MRDVAQVRVRRCLRFAGEIPASHHATTLPKGSDSRRRERAAACSVNQAESSRSGVVKGCRK